MKKLLSKEDISIFFNKALEVPDFIKELNDYELSELKQYAHLKVSNLETELKQASDFFNKGFPQEYIDKYKVHSLNGHLKEIGERASFSGHVEELLTVIEDEMKKRKLPPEIPGQSLIEAYYKKLKESPAFISRLDEFLRTEILTYAKEQAAFDMLWEPGKYNSDEAERMVDSIIQQYKADGALNTNDFLSEIAKDWGHDVREWFSVILLLTDNLKTQPNKEEINKEKKRSHLTQQIMYSICFGLKVSTGEIDINGITQNVIESMLEDQFQLNEKEISIQNTRKILCNQTLFLTYKGLNISNGFIIHNKDLKCWEFKEDDFQKFISDYPDEYKEAKEVLKARNLD